MDEIMLRQMPLPLLLDLIVLEAQNNQHLRDIAYEYWVDDMIKCYNESTVRLQRLRQVIIDRLPGGEGR